MNKISQSEVLAYCIKNKIPFAIYKLPLQPENTLVVSKQVEETSLKQVFELRSDIFVFAPFSVSNESPVFFKSDFVIEEETSSEIFQHIQSISAQEEKSFSDTFYAGFDSYQEQFEKLYSTIQSGEISKAILSRIKHLDAFSRDAAADFYYTLSRSYPRAYTFMVYTPQSGLWTGASPELLLKASGGQGTTVSLAGTRGNNGAEDNWSEKEKDEQQIVTEFVNDIMRKYKLEDVQVTGPETIKAGKMSHLKTQYDFSIQPIEKQLHAFVNDLHPTPAVCGLPKQASMEVIKKSEQHQRTFYAGFLGRVQPQEINLFVNIRSMKFVGVGVDLYLGGGITQGSDVEKEWQETELKSQTMLSVIKEINK